MRKTLVRIIRELKLLSFSWKKIAFSLKLSFDHFYGQSFIKTVRGPSKDLLENLIFVIDSKRLSYVI